MDELQKEHEQELHRVKETYENELKKKKDGFELRLKELEKIMQQAVIHIERRVKNSWTWRIGWVFTSAVVLLKNFLENPYKFAIDKQHRWKDLYYFSNPKQTEPQSKPAIKITETIVETGTDQPDPKKQTLHCILDVFTRTCFFPEFNILSPTPENWKDILSSGKQDALFIESAWHGNDNSWEYLTYQHKQNNNLEILSALISAYKNKNIPTVFWNKEDPVHFDAFVNTAGKFDYIFTTDSDCIPRYKVELGHKHIYPLPFAAQHKIQNPITEEDRNGTVSFAGSYYNFSFGERKIDMDILLKPSLDFGLEIYDRNYGARGVSAEEYKFPDIYQPAIRGRLEFNDMVKAYKRYKAFLNVNSVKYSPTMFSRRVFELLACGTPVISTYSKGIINLLGEDTVLITESEDDTRRHLEKLLNDEHFWWSKSLNGIRIVMESHTYSHRVNEIFSTIGLEKQEQESCSFIIAAEVSSVSDASYLAGILHDQTFSGFEVLIKPAGNKNFSEDEIVKIKESFRQIKLTISSDYSPLFSKKISSSGERKYLVQMKPANYYGVNYLRDFLLAIKYADAKILGKRSYFKDVGGDKIAWQNKGEEFRFCKDLQDGTFVVDQQLLSGQKSRDPFTESIEMLCQIPGLSIDPFNFLENGREAFEHSPERILKEIGL